MHPLLLIPSYPILPHPQSLPLMLMEPRRNFTPDPSYYNCPLYKTGLRAGVLSTTGETPPPMSCDYTKCTTVWQFLSLASSPN